VGSACGGGLELDDLWGPFQPNPLCDYINVIISTYFLRYILFIYHTPQAARFFFVCFSCGNFSEVMIMLHKYGFWNNLDFLD